MIINKYEVVNIKSTQMLTLANNEMINKTRHKVTSTLGVHYNQTRRFKDHRKRVLLAAEVVSPGTQSIVT